MEEQDPRLKYVASYANKYYPNVEFDEEGIFYNNSILLMDYARFHDTIIECLPSNFTKENFDKDETITRMLKKFNIDHDAFWEFTVFIFHIYRQFFISQKRKAFPKFITTICYDTNMPAIGVDKELEKLGKFISNRNANTRIGIKTGKGYIEIKDTDSIHDIIKVFTAYELIPLVWTNPDIAGRLKKIGKDIEECLTNKTDIEVTFINGRKKHEIKDQGTIRRMAELFQADEKRYCGTLVYSCMANTKDSALKYCILKAIYDEIVTRPENIEFTEDEKLLYLAILNLCGFDTQPVTKKRGIYIYQLFQQYKNYDTTIPCIDILFNSGLEVMFRKE